MQKVKAVLKEGLYKLFGLFGEGFSDQKLPPRIILKHIVIQKLFRINANVPWPVHWTSQLKAVDKIDRGTRFPGLGICSYLDGRNGISIGENTWMGPHVRLISMNHNVNNYSDYVIEDPIIIGDNCWISSNVTVLPGVSIGNHVVVAAGSVVTKSIKEDNVLIGGVPAKKIKKLEKYFG